MVYLTLRALVFTPCAQCDLSPFLIFNWFIERNIIDKVIVYYLGNLCM